MDAPELVGAAITSDAKIEDDLLAPSGWPAVPAKKLLGKASAISTWQSCRRKTIKLERGEWRHTQLVVCSTEMNKYAIGLFHLP